MGFEERTITRKCLETGKEFELTQTRFGSIWFPDIKYCDEVLERELLEERAREVRRKQAEQEHKKQEWIKANIPPYFMPDLDRSYTNIDWNAMDMATKWSGGSLVLKGDTRKGKTRAIYEIAKNWADLFPFIETAERLARMLGSALYKSAKSHEALIRRICDERLVCIDDLGKESVTPRTQADLFEIINYRLEQTLPTIISTNYDGEGLMRRFTDQEMSRPLIARIREFKVIEFH
jgi:DNA replication protein DnaC